MLGSGLRFILLGSCVTNIPVWMHNTAEKAEPQLLCDCLIHQLGLLSFLTCVIDVLRKYTNGVGVVLLQTVRWIDSKGNCPWSYKSLSTTRWEGAHSYCSEQEVFVVAVTESSFFLHFNWQSPEVIHRNSGRIWKWVACRISDHGHLTHLPTSFFS